jgi:hypothetical protein
MSEPWFDPNHWAWMPGTVLGTTTGLWGALCGVLIPKGRAKGLVLGAMGALLVASAALLGAGIIAWRAGQPFGVWYGLLWPGVIGLIILGVNFPMVVYSYRVVEQRRMSAQDIPL